MLRIAAILLLTGCGGSTLEMVEPLPPPPPPKPDCISTCGVSAFHLAETCDEFNRLEGVLLKAFTRVASSEAVCSALKGVSLEVVDAETLNGETRDSAQGLYGYYAYGPRRITLPRGSLATNAYAHEVGHVIDTQIFPEMAFLGDHYRWVERYFYFEIQAFWILAAR